MTFICLSTSIFNIEWSFFQSFAHQKQSNILADQIVINHSLGSSSFCFFYIAVLRNFTYQPLFWRLVNLKYDIIPLCSYCMFCNKPWDCCNSTSLSPGWSAGQVREEDSSGVGGGEPCQHERSHMLQVRSHHPAGKLLRHDPPGPEPRSGSACSQAQGPCWQGTVTDKPRLMECCLKNWILCSQPSFSVIFLDTQQYKWLFLKFKFLPTIAQTM